MKKIFSAFLTVFVICNSLFAAQKIHFSVDDVITSFENLTKNESKYKSAFDEPFLKYVKLLHDEFGVKTSLYCFYEKDGFSLADCTDKFAADFSSSSDWLKFGFHALNPNYKFDGGGYKIFVKQIERITGSKNCIAQTLRLDYFEGGKSSILNSSYKNTEYGIKQLLCADSSTRNSYFLDENQKQELNRTEKIDSDGVTFIKTDFRFDDIENFKTLFDENRDEDEIVVFTHEWLFQVPFRKNLLKYFEQMQKSRAVKKNIKRFCEFFEEKNAEYVFEF